MLIDVYDFDGTIYDGDSTVDFVRFTLRRHPALLAGLPHLLLTLGMMALGRAGLTEFKTVLFSEMSRRFSLAQEAEAFWQSEKTRAKLGAWFQRTPRDLPIVVASASPEFELCHAAKLLGVTHLIGTQCDMQTGRLTGPNCKGERKIERIRALMGDFTVRAMYTDDAKADGPLLAIAQEKYIVTHGTVERLNA